MKLSRQALLAALDTVESEYKTAQEKYEAQLKGWHVERRKKWDAEMLPRWKALRDALSDAIRNRQPISTELVDEAAGPNPRGYRTHVLSEIAWTADPALPYEANGVARPTEPSHQLDSLRLVLQAITDDEVSDHQLRSLGYRNLEWLFNAATVNKAAL